MIGVEVENVGTVHAEKLFLQPGLFKWNDNSGKTKNTEVG